jgi:hypothetical protein
LLFGPERVALAAFPAMGLRQAMLFLYLPLVYILAIGFWARPIVSNATISLKRVAAEGQRWWMLP